MFCFVWNWTALYVRCLKYSYKISREQISAHIKMHMFTDKLLFKIFPYLTNRQEQ